MFKRVRRYLNNPYYAFGNDIIKSHPNMMSDKYYLKVLWHQIMGYELDLNNPKTFNEKLQWIKLYDRNPLYTKLVDKYLVKQWVAEKIGEEHIIPTIAVYDSVAEIDLDKLPNQFVLKCNHDSGGVVICKDKSNFDFAKAKNRIQQSFDRNFYWEYREWPYKNVKRRIIAEQYMKNSDETDLLDYKVFTFDGEPRFIEVDFDRFTNHTRNLYDIDWHLIDAQIGYPAQKERICKKPSALAEMLALSRKLAQGFKHVRTDFYIINDQIFFGEMTFIHGAGTEMIYPESFGHQMGDWIKLP